MSVNNASERCRGFGRAWGCVLGMVLASSVAHADGPFMATGIRTGEVTESSAIVWTRLTRTEERVPFGAGMPIVEYLDTETGEWGTNAGRRRFAPRVRYPEGLNVDTIEGAVPGAPGHVRVHYRVRGSSDWSSTDWTPVDIARDYVHQFTLTDLQPDARYELRAEGRGISGSAPTVTIDGGFRTAPAHDDSQVVMFAVSTGQRYSHRDSATSEFDVYDAIVDVDPHFFVHTGDIVYYDEHAKNVALARWHWARTYSFGTNTRFHRQVSSYFMKDDHDTWMNDSWPGHTSPHMGEFTFEQGLEIFLEQVPMGERTYRTVRWGKDLQIWMVEGRDFRSPNNLPDGPDKTIWGAEQKAWFKRTVEASDATFRVLISPTPVVGPDRPNKKDNHSNAVFAHEGGELREFISQQKNMVVVCGDRHWQYVSVDPTTGLREYSCGPANDNHANGWSNEDRFPQHEYLNVVGGFLSVTVDGGELIARHHAVNGEVLNEDRVVAE